MPHPSRTDVRVHMYCGMDLALIRELHAHEKGDMDGIGRFQRRGRGN